MDLWPLVKQITPNLSSLQKSNTQPSPGKAKQPKPLIHIQGNKTLAIVGVSCLASAGIQPDRTHAAKKTENPLGSNCE